MIKKLKNCSFNLLLVKKQIQNTIMSDKCFEFRLKLICLLELQDKYKYVRSNSIIIDKLSNSINLSFFSRNTKNHE